jgi:hypothetical protein
MVMSAIDLLVSPGLLERIRADFRGNSGRVSRA